MVHCQPQASLVLGHFSWHEHIFGLWVSDCSARVIGVAADQYSGPYRNACEYLGTFFLKLFSPSQATP